MVNGHQRVNHMLGITTVVIADFNIDTEKKETLKGLLNEILNTISTKDLSFPSLTSSRVKVFRGLT